MTLKLRIRKDVIREILTSEEFKDRIKNDPQFYFNYENIAIKVIEYAIEKNLPYDKNELSWDKVSMRTIKAKLIYFKQEIAVLEDLDPMDMRWQKKRRHEIIEDIMARDDFRKQLCVGVIVTKDILIMINDYAIKNGLWKEGLSLSTLRNDFTYLYNV